MAAGGVTQPTQEREPEVREPGGTEPSDAPTLAIKFGIAVAASLVNAVIYLVPNHFPLRAAQQLPMGAIDRAVPFVQETVWVYLSDYALVALAFLFVRTMADARRFARAYFAMLVAGAAVHVAWPTVYPRELFPLVGSGLTVAAFDWLRGVDAPTSCMPSMHVAGSWLAALTLWRHPRLPFTVWVVWATAVSVSTLTTKQHYALDIVAGIALALATWAAFFWWPARRAALTPG